MPPPIVFTTSKTFSTQRGQAATKQVFNYLNAKMPEVIE
jgi:hypothetical protein